jgi:hypothetical protein
MLNGGIICKTVNCKGCSCNQNIPGGTEKSHAKPQVRVAGHQT